MKRSLFAVLAFAFAGMACAAELPPLGDDFPAGWKKGADKVCTLKEGVVLHIEGFEKETGEGVTKVVVLQAKNDVYFSQTTAMYFGKTPISMTTAILKDDEVVMFDMTDEESAVKMLTLTLETLGVTKEYEACVTPKKKRSVPPSSDPIPK